MKINKIITESVAAIDEKEIDTVEEALTEAEEASDEEMIIDDVLSASVSEIADAVQDAAEDASDGKETYSDEKAETIAAEIKKEANGFDAAAWAPLDVPSELTDKLDDCLANALVAHASGTHDGVDLLVTGLPGSGKTGITKQWAKDRGVNLFYLNAKNDDLGAILNGFPVDTTEETDDNIADWKRVVEQQSDENVCYYEVKRQIVLSARTSTGLR
jgi:hypothetical protein